MKSHWMFFALNAGIAALLAALAAAGNEPTTGPAVLLAQAAVQLAVAAVLFCLAAYHR
jgi:hypothetical protein